MLKRAICLFVCMSFILCGCVKKEEPQNDLSVIMKRDKLIVGVKDDSPPFGSVDENGNYTGLDIDLAHMIAKYLLGDPNKIEFVPVTLANRIGTLYSGDVDMVIATMSITPNRMQIVDFSSPYHTAGQAVLVRKSSNITTLNELNGKKVIIVYGSTGEKAIRMHAPEIILLGYKDYREAFKALKEGKADAMSSDDTILMKYALSDSSVKILPKRYSREPYAIAFRKGQESRALRDKVEVFLSDYKKSGKMGDLCTKWGVD